MATATRSPSSFLDLPLEIRNYIYTCLLVEEDTFREKCEATSDGSDYSDIVDYSDEERVSSREGSVSINTARSSVDTDDTVDPELVHGAVLISELHPGKLKPGNRSTYWTAYWDRTGLAQRMTYCIGSDVDLRVFHVCRQTYEEATYIFYTKNLFYIESIETLVPFLKDQSSRARALLRRLSIPVPCGTQRDEEGDRIIRYYRVNNSTFEAACCQLSKSPELLANLTQLDLRMWDFDTSYNSRGNPNLDTLKMSTKRAKQLASIAEPGVMTLSFRDWQAFGGSGPTSHSVFESLPCHISRKIQRFREDFLLGTHSPQMDTVKGEDKDSGADGNDDEGHYMSWSDILMGRRGTNAI